MIDADRLIMGLNTGALITSDDISLYPVIWYQGEGGGLAEADGTIFIKNSETKIFFNPDGSEVSFFS